MACEWLLYMRDKVVRTIFDKLNTMIIPNNAAIVFDIDHTLIDQFGNPIEPVVYLFNAIKQRGITPVIITARQGDEMVTRWTQDQLERLNITEYRSIYFLPPGRTDPWRFKMLARKNIHDNGYVVIMTIGDEPWDHGEYGGIGYIIPKCFCATSTINMQYFAN